MNLHILFILWALCSLYADVGEFKRNVLRSQSSINGWCSQEKASHFIDLVLEVKPKVCVEIGVLCGSSIFPVASTLQYLDQGILIAIDAWDREECVKYLDPTYDAAHFEWWSTVNLDQYYHEFLEMLREYSFEKYCFVMKTSSEKAAAAIGSIDILYLDGNYSEIATIRDVQLYLPKVRSGGYIWINDTLAECKQEAVNLLFEECTLVKTISELNCFLFQKL